MSGPSDSNGATLGLSILKGIAVGLVLAAVAAQSIAIAQRAAPQRALTRPDAQILGARIKVEKPVFFSEDPLLTEVRYPHVVQRPVRGPLSVPPGFVVELFAEELTHPRWLAEAPNGDIFLAEPSSGSIRILQDRDGDGRADRTGLYASGFHRPHGMAFLKGRLLVSDQSAVWSIPYKEGAVRAPGPRQPVTRPGALGRGGLNWPRTLLVAPEDARMFVGVGSRFNLAEESEPFATIQQFSLDGEGQRTFAAGLRSPVGMAFHPASRELYVVVEERQWSDGYLASDFLTRVERGDHFGWPYAVHGPNPDPRFGALAPEKVAGARKPDVLFEPASSPFSIAFSPGAGYPERYRDGAFVSLRGAWNRAAPTGFKVVWVPFDRGRPQGGYENFAVGFWLNGPQGPEIWGRPAGLLMTKKGDLLVTDEVGKAVWRIKPTHAKPRDG